jgi:hypothetical protein
MKVVQLDDIDATTGAPLVGWWCGRPGARAPAAMGAQRRENLWMVKAPREVSAILRFRCQPLSQRF